MRGICWLERSLHLPVPICQVPVLVHSFVYDVRSRYNLMYSNATLEHDILFLQRRTCCASAVQITFCCGADGEHAQYAVWSGS
jgi:hypothetical protein